MPSKKVVATFNITKALAGATLTTIAAIGGASGNPWMAGLAAFPAAGLASYDSIAAQIAALGSTEQFEATQRNPGVKRLAVNPLLLTILALIQRQGIELPSHRIELFELCATTLLDTWVKARGQSTHFTRDDLIKILRPLAFWMHEHPAVGAIPERELI